MTLISLLGRHPRIAAACVLIAALAALPFAARLEVDNSIEVWIDHQSEAYRTYQHFLTEFGSEEYLLVIYDAPPALDNDFLFELTDLRLELEEIEGVRFGIDLSSLRGKLFGGATSDDFGTEARRSPFFQSFLISEDGSSLATWLLLDIDSPAARFPIVESVEAVLQEQWPDREVRLAGTPAISVALDRSSRQSARTLFPLVFVVSGVALILRFRQPLAVVVPMISVGVGIVVTLALMQISGSALDMVTSALPSVLWILGLSTSIHLLSSYRRHLGTAGEQSSAVREAMHEVARPCLYSAITTSLGFLALAASEIEPVRAVGLFAAAGILFCLASNFALFPVLMSFSRRPRSSADPAAVLPGDSWPKRLGESAIKRPLAVLVVATVVTVVLGVAISRIQTDSNVVSFFKPSTEIATTYREILPGLTGPFSLELLFSPPGEVVSLETFAELDRLETLVADVPGVAKTLSPAGLVKKMHQMSSGAPPDSWELPPDEDFFSLAWGATERSLHNELSTLYDSESGTIRASLLVRPMESAAHRELVASVRELVAREADPAWAARLTGIVDLLVEMQAELMRSQVLSFLLAFLLIGPVIAALLRSPHYAFLSLPPNLLPVVTALGTMGLLTIHLNPGTVMTAAMALGIAVDDTIHFLTHYRQERAGGCNTRLALERTLDTVAHPIADTSVIAAAGFVVLAFSQFVPLIYFGLLTALSLMTALVADLDRSSRSSRRLRSREPMSPEDAFE